MNNRNMYTDKSIFLSIFLAAVLGLLGGFCLGYLIAENQIKKKLQKNPVIKVDSFYRLA